MVVPYLKCRKRNQRKKSLKRVIRDHFKLENKMKYSTADTKIWLGVTRAPAMIIAAVLGRV